MRQGRPLPHRKILDGDWGEPLQKLPMVNTRSGRETALREPVRKPETTPFPISRIIFRMIQGGAIFILAEFLPDSFSSKRRTSSANHLLRTAFFLPWLMDHDLLDYDRNVPRIRSHTAGHFPLNILERSRDEERYHLGHLPLLSIFEKDHGMRMGGVLIE